MSNVAAPATITVHPSFVTGEIDRRIFGSFVEHLGRAVYTGIFEPGHPTADEQGFRADVAELTRELGTTVVRYPGGNFVSNYDWRDGIGPRAERPRRADLAWRTIETNQVGTDEFVAWCRTTGTEPMFAVNLGTRGIEDAAKWVEYCNLPGGTDLSDERRANGSEAPHDVRLWCLGNEMDGPWQIGHKTAEEYGRLASQAAQAMLRTDPSIELVVCGSSARDIATYGEWERIVLEHTYEQVDYISVHAYYQERDGDRSSFLGSGEALDRFIREVAATADAVGARKRSDKRIRLSVDEWNVWYIDDFVGEDNIAEFVEAPPLLEDVYSLIDAVVVGDLLATLLRNADRVAIACLAQLVNVIAPIRTEPGGAAWRQTTFYPIALVAELASGVALDARVVGPTIETAKHGDIPGIGTAVTWDAATGSLVFLLTNRGTEALPVELDHAAFGTFSLDRAVTIVSDAAGPRTTAESASAAQPVALDGVVVAPGSTMLTLPAESWSLVALTLED